MAIPRVRPMTKEEEEQNQRPQLEKGRYYAGMVKVVDFFRNKEGRIVGLRPTKPIDGKSAHPFGQMRLKIEIKLDEIEQVYTVGIPCPWDTQKAPPWNGPHDAAGNPQFDEEGKALGQANTFTDEQATQFVRPVRTGQMKNKLAALAEKFGWQPFRVYATDVLVNDAGEVVVDSVGKPAPITSNLPPMTSVVKAGQPIRQWLDISALLTGRRVMVGEIESENKRYTDTDIMPVQDETAVPIRQKKDAQAWVGELLAALKDQKLNSGQPFTVENALDAAKGQPGLEEVKPNTIAEHLTPAQWEALGDVLAQSCINRSIVPPGKYLEEEKAEVRGV